MTSITFLTSQIITLEESKGKNFNKSKREIYHNFIWMIVIFVIELFTITSYTIGNTSLSNSGTIYDSGYMLFIMTFFFFFSYLLYELVDGIIFLTKNR